MMKGTAKRTSVTFFRGSLLFFTAGILCLPLVQRKAAHIKIIRRNLMTSVFTVVLSNVKNTTATSYVLNYDWVSKNTFTHQSLRQ